MRMKEIMIKFPDTITELYFIGDIHGNLDYVKYKVSSLHLHDCLIILCGDVGLGFSPIQDTDKINYISKFLQKHNVYVVGIRGNHDDPSFFVDTSLTKNWINVPDYTVLTVLNQNILCVGGGTSIDRKWRIANNYGYWPNEKAQYQPKCTLPISIICSHISPSFTYPLTKGDIVNYYTSEDPELLRELDEERQLMDKIWEDYKKTLTHWFYGHYHADNIEYIENVKFTLLNCEKLAQYYEREKDNLL